MADEPLMRITISYRVKELIEENRKNTYSFAKSINVDNKTIMNLLSCASTPSLKVLSAISETYGVSIAWLIGESSTREIGGKISVEDYGLTFRAAMKIRDASKGEDPCEDRSDMPFQPELASREEYLRLRRDAMAFESLGKPLVGVPSPDKMKDESKFRFMEGGQDIETVVRSEAEILNYLISDWRIVSDILCYLRAFSPMNPFIVPKCLRYNETEAQVLETLLRDLKDLKRKAREEIPWLCSYYTKEQADRIPGMSAILDRSEISKKRDKKHLEETLELKKMYENIMNDDSEED